MRHIQDVCGDCRGANFCVDGEKPEEELVEPDRGMGTISQIL